MFLHAHSSRVPSVWNSVHRRCWCGALEFLQSKTIQFKIVLHHFNDRPRSVRISAKAIGVVEMYKRREYLCRERGVDGKDQKSWNSVLYFVSKYLSLISFLCKSTNWNTTDCTVLYAIGAIAQFSVPSLS